MRIAPYVVAGIGVLVVIFLIVAPPWQLPPVQSTSTGPAAGEMVQFDHPERPLPYNVLPASIPAAAEGGPRAGAAYKNVKVLGDVSKAEFDRTMKAMTEWIAPKQGCAFCHDSSGNYAADDVYTKTVARQMLAMTRAINAQWKNHVGTAGVTCYTCHRGKNVPPYHWYEQAEDHTDGLLGQIPDAENFHYDAETIQDFFPDKPDELWLLKNTSTNAQSMTAMAGDGPKMSLHNAEHLYILMMKMANEIGVNCTYCHNSRSFADWSQSPPFRLIAWYGIEMVRALNNDFIKPLSMVIPKTQLGHLGDPAMINCGTCHVGRPQPLGGVNILSAFPAFSTANGTSPVVRLEKAVNIEEKDTASATRQFARNGAGGPVAAKPEQTPGFPIGTPPIAPSGDNPAGATAASAAPMGNTVPTGAEPQPGLFQGMATGAYAGKPAAEVGNPQPMQPALTRNGSVPAVSVDLPTSGGPSNLETGSRDGRSTPSIANQEVDPPRNTAPAPKDMGASPAAGGQ